MLAQELYDYYGSWAEIIRKLQLGISTPKNWQKIGYIPYKTQLLIERETNGLFVANKEHSEPKYRETIVKKAHN